MTEDQAQAVRIGDTVSRVAAGRIRRYTVTGVRVGLISGPHFRLAPLDAGAPREPGLVSHRGCRSVGDDAAAAGAAR